MPNAILLRNPRALLVPDVIKLVNRAVKSVPLLELTELDGAAAQEFFDYCTDENSFLFLGFEDGHAHALMMGYFPTSALFPYPVISLIYNEGSKALLRIVVNEWQALLTSRGYSRTWALNGSGRSDAAWLRCLLPDDWTGKKIASMMELTLK